MFLKSFKFFYFEINFFNILLFWYANIKGKFKKTILLIYFLNKKIFLKLIFPVLPNALIEREKTK